MRLILFLTAVLLPCVVLSQSNSTSAATTSSGTPTTSPTAAPSAKPKPKPGLGKRPKAKYAQKKGVQTGKAAYGTPKRGKKVNTGNAAYGRPAKGYSPKYGKGNLQAQGWGQNAFGVQWTPSQQGGNQIPRYGGDGGIGAGGQVSGCYLQLSSGQWVWNSLTIVQQCGGFICLNTTPKKLHWTVRPDLIPHVAMQFCQAANQPAVAANEQESAANEEGNAVEESNVPEVKEQSAPACECSAWDYPGDCGPDGTQFRWRSCVPRYCDIEDQYVNCEA